MAASKVFAAQALHKPVPQNWLIDRDGIPTTDPTGYPVVGALLPMAGHKGYGIALMIEILTAVISGGAVATEVKSWLQDFRDPVNQSHAFIAIDINTIVAIKQFQDRMSRLISIIKKAPLAKGVDRIYLPGEMEWEKRKKALIDGMILPDDAIVSLKNLAKNYKLNIKGFSDNI